MLMALGPVVFDVVANLSETELAIDAAFAKHDVVGANPVYEAMGGDGASVTLTGVIHPEVFGVNGALARLEAAEAAQMPLPLMRGTFEPLGWVIIQKLNRSDRSLNPYGLGREVNFTVTLLRVGTPALSLAPGILGLFR
jgi:uncharacterized protein